jgi:formiminotetrahydrofolate cyclodeaminase
MSRLSTLPFAELLSRTAAKTPTPGGGAVACATGALAAALAGMVVSYSLGKKNLAAHQPELERAAHVLENARGLFLSLAQEDEEAYGLVNELMKLPEADPRRAELPAALQASIQVPMAAIAAAADLLRLCESLAPITNRHLHSDLGIAACLAEATGRASLWNVRINAGMLTDEAARRLWMDQAAATLADASARAAALDRHLQSA